MAGIDANTLLMLHCDGIDGDAVFPDASDSNHTVTAHGNAQVDTAEYKFATGSLLLDGTGDYLTIPNSADFDLGLGDFTLDLWVYPTSFAAYNGIISSDNAAGGGGRWILYTNNDGVVRFSNTEAVSDLVTSGDQVLIINQWNHIAVIRKGTGATDLNIYIGGVAGNAPASGNVTLDSDGAGVVIGRTYISVDLHYFTGWMDEFRLSDSARWTTGFTPPTEEYSVIATETTTILSDADIVDTPTRRIFSDARIHVDDQEITILSDAKVVLRTLITILSDAFVVAGMGLDDISNKFRMVKQSLSDINNKSNFASRVLSNINNTFNMICRILSDIDNDVRTQKRELYNINNDIRFIKSWQVPGTYGFQSLGKAYIKVYINDVEQTDVDVDSIEIHKELNISHTASFALGRAYDGSQPTLEHVVLIKYNDYVLYRGYVVAINPGDTPESIIINCQDEYWKQNRENKYFFVGHQPSDDTELYYSTIQTALSTEYSLSLGIGDFVPQTMDLFAVGKADCLSRLVQMAGNYDIYYDVSGNPQLRKSGSGNILEMPVQAIGTNIELYDVINHQIKESGEHVVNKFRVQMGDKIIRRYSSTGGNRGYTAYRYRIINDWCSPSWDVHLEDPAHVASSGHGVDYHPPSENDTYKDVFRVWKLPFWAQLGSNQQWTDRYAPEITVYAPNFNYVNFYSQLSEFKITEGFTVDYENQLIIFNEPLFLWKESANTNGIELRAPVIKIKLWQKSSYTVTEDPSDDPEVDVSNPLMFYTDKMGTYPVTIIKDLSLASLSIQEGVTYIDANGDEQVIPSWDDTEFAEDMADWQLSKVCDKRVEGALDLTLDAICYYGVDLKKRLYMSDIMSESVNIESLTYNIRNFTVTVQFKNGRIYKRAVSLPSRGE